MTLGDMLLAANLNSSCSIQALKVIADAHKASLADEREKWREKRKLDGSEILQLRQQLAAEREKIERRDLLVRTWQDNYNDREKEVQQLRSQLAAESQLNADIGAVIRDFAVELCGTQFGSTGDEAAYTPKNVRAFLSQLRQQLAAEWEWESRFLASNDENAQLQKQLAACVDALKSILDSQDWWQTKSIIDAALAKAGWEREVQRSKAALAKVKEKT